MIEKIVNWWLTGIIVLLFGVLTLGLLIASIILTCITNNALLLLLNTAYLFLVPLFILGWQQIIELIKDGGVL